MSFEKTEQKRIIFNPHQEVIPMDFNSRIPRKIKDETYYRISYILEMMNKILRPLRTSLSHILFNPFHNISSRYKI